MRRVTDLLLKPSLDCPLCGTQVEVTTGRLGGLTCRKCGSILKEQAATAGVALAILVVAVLTGMALLPPLYAYALVSIAVVLGSALIVQLMRGVRVARAARKGREERVARAHVLRPASRGVVISCYVIRGVAGTMAGLGWVGAFLSLLLVLAAGEQLADPLPDPFYNDMRVIVLVPTLLAFLGSVLTKRLGKRIAVRSGDMRLERLFGLW